MYGTSGPRILLWFDLLNGPNGPAPMGSEVTGMERAPRFRAAAAGAFGQKPGCPEHVGAALSPERIHELCLGECYHPSDRRHAIERIEVVRVRPQRSAGEPVTPLIEDPWRSLPCAPDSAGCRVEFSDPDFAGSGRDAVDYVRALQEPTPALNGANLRTRFDAAGRATAVEPCFVGAAEKPGDDCLADVQERAWSSPIFVDQRR